MNALGKRCLLPVSLLFFFIIGCSGASVTVNVIRDKYNPQLDHSLKELYKGKKLFFIEVIDATSDTTNFHYYSPDKKVGYAMFYKGDAWQQPLVSFFWYAYQKAFESVGIVVEEEKPSPDSPELKITFHKFNSRELILDVLLIKKAVPIGQVFQKRYTVIMPPLGSSLMTEWEKAAYDMIDTTIYMILADSEFQKVFLN